MDGGLDHCSRDELLVLLADWNIELLRHQARVLIPIEAAERLTIPALRDVVAGTASRLGRVVRAVGEQ